LTTEKSSNLRIGCNATRGLSDRQEIINISVLYVETLDYLLHRLCGGAVCYILHSTISVIPPSLFSISFGVVCHGKLKLDEGLFQTLVKIKLLSL